MRSFNTQPPEGGCTGHFVQFRFDNVSTHSHPKVAAFEIWLKLAGKPVSTHSHPKVAAFLVRTGVSPDGVSTHSHPKVAAAVGDAVAHCRFVSTHSHPKVAARYWVLIRGNIPRFNTQPPEGGCASCPTWCSVISCFNTQPPEGGCQS